MATEVTVRGTTYQIGRLSARAQWNVARRVLPLVEGVVPAIRSALPKRPLVKMGDDGPDTDQAAAIDWAAVGTACLGPITEALSHLTDADSDYVIDTCLACVRRPNGAGQQVPVMRNGQFMFQQDDDFAVLIALTAAVLQENLGGFLAELPGLLGGTQGA